MLQMPLKDSRGRGFHLPYLLNPSLSRADSTWRSPLLAKHTGYMKGKGLRGRKVYPHHAALPDSHWQNPMEDRTQVGNGPWQEYRRPRKEGEEQRDSQNRSILAWVKPGTEFTFDIHLLNLSAAELGALLWLLKLPENHYLRFGGGKHSLKKKYCAWDAGASTAASDVVRKAIEAFRSAVAEAYGEGKDEGFENISFIKAFLQACRGFDDGKTVHYPRATQDGRPGPPSPDGESFKWFVANERQENRYALRDLWDDAGLPILKDPQPSGGYRKP